MRIFFFKQKTAYEVRISDWSSDVCSSDLLDSQERRRTGAHPPPVAQQSLWPRGTGLRRQGRPSRLDDRHRPALAEESADRGRRGRAVGGRRLRLCRRAPTAAILGRALGSEAHTSALQSLMRLQYPVTCLNKKNTQPT